MPLYDFSEFLKLSSALNYNLSATSLNRYNVLMFIIDGKHFHSNDTEDRESKRILMETLSYLFNAYSQKRRRLGPLAVLHPLRTAALFARNFNTLNLIDLLSALLHDILEDIKPVDFKVSNWKDIEEQLYGLLKQLPSEDELDLTNRLLSLTKLKEESYYRYIGRLLEHSGDAFQLIQVKLADRLDNTLDMRIDLQDPLKGIDFFQNIFQLLYVNNYRGYIPATNHPPPTAINGARRLYQLFKNAVLLSLIRQKIAVEEDPISQLLFDAVCMASLKEAQRTLIHLIGYHFKDVQGQRTLLLEAMDYCYSGGTGTVTVPDADQMLDGLFSSYFAHAPPGVRNQKLDILYEDKPLMIQASLAFVTIFLSFMNDSKFYVAGISAEGISPKN
jgi:hypothetical protein